MTKVVQLWKVLNTRYIASGQLKELKSFLDNFDGDEVDLGSCRLTPQAWSIIKQYFSKITFRNYNEREHDELDPILVHNNNISKQAPERAQLNFDYTTYDEFIEMMNSLDTSKVYTLDMPSSEFLRRHISAVILITMKRPEIMIDMCDKASVIFRTVREDWLRKTKFDHGEYIEVDGACIWDRAVNPETNKVHIFGEGSMSEEDYVKSHIVLPKSFGREKIYYKGSEFEDVWMNAVENLLPKVTSTVTLRDFIEVRGQE